MTETEYFKDRCRALSHSKSASLFFRDLIKKNKKAESDGVTARFRFDGFFVDINLFLKGKRAALPNLIVLYCGFTCEENVLFSVYDIFAALGIGDFKSYTYPSVFEKRHFDAVFSDIESLFKKLLPALFYAAENGVVRNKMLEQRKNEIRAFCKNPDLFDPAVPYNDVYLKLSEIIIDGFYDSEITNAATGALSFAPNGKIQRAKKALETKKHTTLYERNLLAFLNSEKSAGFDFSPLGPLGKEFENEIKENERRLSLKIFSLALAFLLPSFGVLFVIYLVLCAVMFKDAVFTVGTGLLNGLILAAPSIALSAIFAIIRVSALEKKQVKKDDVSPPELISKKALRPLLIFAECFALVFCLFASNTTCAFYDNCVKLEDPAVFSLGQIKCNYSEIECIEIKSDGITPPYFNAVLKDGSSLYLFEATASNEKKFRKYAPQFFSERGIDVYAEKL